MAYKYCVAVNSGKGFINARERMEFHLSGHPGNIWGVGDNVYGNAWIKRNNVLLKQKKMRKRLWMQRLQQISPLMMLYPKNKN